MKTKRLDLIGLTPVETQLLAELRALGISDIFEIAIAFKGKKVEMKSPRFSGL